MDNEESLECPVCTEIYNEDSHTPKMMPCLHTVCASCIVDMVRRASGTPARPGPPLEGHEPPVPRGKTIPCPLCREDLSTDRLQTNRYVLAHLRDLARLEALQKPEGRRKPPPPPPPRPPPPPPPNPLCRRRRVFVRLRRPGQPPPAIPAAAAKEPPPIPPRLRQEPASRPRVPAASFGASVGASSAAAPPAPPRCEAEAPSAPPQDDLEDGLEEMWCRTCEEPARAASCVGHVLAPLLKEEEMTHLEERQRKGKQQRKQERQQRRREQKQQQRQERRDRKAAARLANAKPEERQQSSTRPAVGVDGRPPELSEWTYEQILEAINTSCDLEFLQACHREFDRRRQEYRRTIRRRKGWNLA